MLSNGIGTLVSGFKHDSIKTFFNCQDLIFVTGNAAASIINGIDSIVGKGDFFIHVTVFQCQQYSHDLGDTCRVMLFINGFGIQDRSGGCFHDNSGFSIDLWTGCRRLVVFFASTGMANRVLAQSTDARRDTANLLKNFMCYLVIFLFDDAEIFTKHSCEACKTLNHSIL